MDIPNAGFSRLEREAWLHRSRNVFSPTSMGYEVLSSKLGLADSEFPPEIID